MSRAPSLTEMLSSPTSRRRFLAGTATAAIALGLQQSQLTFAERRIRVNDDPFTLGVASGDPTPDGVVLWTRLAPDPLHGGGLDRVGPVDVDWAIARDERMLEIVGRGAAVADPAWAHSVHVEVAGLEPGRDYFYRFAARGYRSPIGRTRTAPPGDRELERLRLAFCSCANFQTGWFAGYRHMAEEDLDLVLHLGDYFYESGPAYSSIPGRVHTMPAAGAKALQLTTLSDYRDRHALYKTDPALQAAHAAAPWVVVTDDHDVENNYAGGIDEEADTDPAAFLRQRAAAYRAYYEHMPVRRRSMPVGPDMRLYRTLRFGDLLDLHMLDGRQYRTDQPDDRSTPAGREQAKRDFRPGMPPGGNPGGTMLGAQQERWLLDGLRSSPARWNALGNQVMMAEFNFGRYETPANGGPVSFNVDNWDGYGAQRQRILQTAATSKVDLVVLTGDAHSAWVHDLEGDFDQPGHPVATEFVGTSITSAFPPNLWPQTERAAREGCPWTHYLDGRQRGYAICDVNRDEWRTDFRMVDSSPDDGRVLRRNAGVGTAASFVVERGQAGAKRAYPGGARAPLRAGCRTCPATAGGARTHRSRRARRRPRTAARRSACPPAARPRVRPGSSPPDGPCS